MGKSQQWAVIFVDDEIGRYYRHLFIKQHPYLNGWANGNRLARPLWGSHLSFLRSETSKLWGLDNNKLIEFEYEPGIKDNGTYFWLNVSCPYLLDLRQRLGLPRAPKQRLHLTIGILHHNGEKK